MKTTMQALLTGQEEQAITEAWRQLTSLERPTITNLDDAIPIMLGHATSLIERAHRLRRVISDASYYAERRAFPEAKRAGRPKKIPGPFDLATKILELGITEDEVQSFLSGRKPQ